MKRCLHLIYSNKLFALMLLAVQIISIFIGYFELLDYQMYIRWAYTILTFTIILIEVNRTTNPTFKITWLLLIAFIPVFGTLFYLYTRIDITSKTISYDLNKGIDHVRSEEPSDSELLEKLSAEESPLYGSAKFLSQYGSAPVFTDTDIKYYSLGDFMYEDMLEELQKAERFIFLEFFIINREGHVWPEILSILKKKAEHGVDVRVIYDGMGCLTTLPKYYEEELNAAHIKCRTFLPVQPLLSTYQNNRDHRKIMVIDGKTAFTGGINLADEYANLCVRFGHWKDTGIKLSGSAAAGFTSLFLQMWNGLGMDDTKSECREFMSAAQPVKSKGIVIPFGDSPLDNISVGLRVYIDMINRAAHHVNIMTPYLVIDDEMFNALRYAVQRGVKVKLILPHIPDKKYAFWLARTYYPQLIRSGVKIYEYTPGFIHAKVCECDGKNAVVGTINYDFRSLFLHHECAALIYDMPVINDIHDDFEKTLYSCQHITYEEFKKFNIFTRFIGRVVRLIAPLL